MNGFALYFRYIAVSLRSQMQYKMSFVMQSLGNLLVTALEIAAIWFLFQRFSSLKDWNFAEVAFFYGMIHLSFAVAEAVGRGFDVFPRYIKSGDFDRMLLRPRSTILQVTAAEFQLMRIGRFLQGGIVLAFACVAGHVDWSLAKAGLLAFALLGGACLFFGLFVLQATMAFWTVESLEIMNTVTYGGTETAQYPMSIYGKWFRRFFTFVVPLACANYFPASVILSKPDFLNTPVWLAWICPLAGPLFMGFSLLAWNIGIRHYRSTGS